MTDNKFLLVLVFIGLPFAIVLMPLIVVAVTVAGLGMLVNDGFRRLRASIGHFG